MVWDIVILTMLTFKLGFLGSFYNAPAGMLICPYNGKPQAEKENQNRTTQAVRSIATFLRKGLTAKY
jgi:hypothetical protein